MKHDAAGDTVVPHPNSCLALRVRRHRQAIRRVRASGLQCSVAVHVLALVSTALRSQAARASKAQTIQSSVAARENGKIP